MLQATVPSFPAKQPEDTLLNEEQTQRYQAITGSVMYLAQVLRHESCTLRVNSLVLCRNREGTPGGGEASSALSGWNHGLEYRLQERRLQTHRLLGLQLGQQPRQRQVDFMLHHDVVQGSGELQVRSIEPDRNVHDEG